MKLVLGRYIRIPVEAIRTCQRRVADSSPAATTESADFAAGLIGRSSIRPGRFFAGAAAAAVPLTALPIPCSATSRGVACGAGGPYDTGLLGAGYPPRGGRSRGAQPRKRGFRRLRRALPWVAWRFAPMHTWCVRSRSKWCEVAGVDGLLIVAVHTVVVGRRSVDPR